jgi:hypothetical protein
MPILLRQGSKKLQRNHQLDKNWILSITPIYAKISISSHYSIYPAIPDGLSLNAKTGTISGVPIVASDPVTYTVTAVVRRSMKVLLIDVGAEVCFIRNTNPIVF